MFTFKVVFLLICGCRINVIHVDAIQLFGLHKIMSTTLNLIPVQYVYGNWRLFYGCLNVSLLQKFPLPPILAHAHIFCVLYPMLFT